MTSLIRYCLSLILDYWERSRIRKAMRVLIPSLLQFVQPSFSGRHRTGHDVAEQRQRRGKSMEEFVKRVEVLFTEPVELAKLLQMSRRLQEEYRERLRSSALSMLPSFQHTLPSGEERGDYLALDVGGSTFRVALVRLEGRGKDGQSGLAVRQTRSFVIDEDVRRLCGRDFFDWMAARIEQLLKEHDRRNGELHTRLQMGLAWSFPIEQTSPRTGKLLQMGKGFAAGHGVEGEDISGLVMEACRARGLNVEFAAIVNDSAATLLAQAYRDSATRMSLILGTGMNAAVYLPVNALAGSKFGSREDSWYALAERVVVNTELSMYGKKVLPTTPWDEMLNADHRLPDYQPLEYLITGRYLGEILRLILMEAITTADLFDGEIPHRLDEAYAFETRVLAIIESDRTPDLAKASAAFTTAHPMRSPPKVHELEYIRDIGRLASRRAAAYLATALHALWAVRTTAEGIELDEASHVTIACDGSMIEKYPDFRARTQSYLDELCVLSGASRGTVTLDMTPESSIFGAAVAVSCMA